MTARNSPGSGKGPKVEKLELNRETVQDLSDSQAAAVEGGNKPGSGIPACASYQEACPESGRARTCYLSCHIGCTQVCPVNEPGPR
jgi:hypothetical protein